MVIEILKDKSYNKFGLPGAPSTWIIHLEREKSNEHLLKTKFTEVQTFP